MPRRRWKRFFLFIRYFVVHNYVCNGDSYTGSIIHNYYLHESDGRLSMIPWDYNLAFGTFRSADAGVPLLILSAAVLALGLIFALLCKEKLK